MFSAVPTVRDGNSPPKKRARTLDIADVSCLVATKQRAAFPSPERPPTKTKPPPSKTLLTDVFSQELIEEDSIIQSSLPQYLNHVFGDSIIGGSSESKAPPTAYSSLNCSTSASTCMNMRDIPNHAPLTIQESQGFTVADVSSLNTTGSAANNLIKNESIAGMELSPLLFNSPPSLPTSSNHSSSYILAHDSKSLLKPAAHEKSTPASTLSPSCEKPAHTPLPATPSISLVTKSNANKLTKRKRKLSGSRTSTAKTKYTCPPSCVNLDGCVHMKTESIVSILAIVLQGIHEMYYEFLSCLFLYQLIQSWR